jgi:hypothetical protein
LAIVLANPLAVALLPPTPRLVCLAWLPGESFYKLFVRNFVKLSMRNKYTRRAFLASAGFTMAAVIPRVVAQPAEPKHTSMVSINLASDPAVR